MLLRASRGAAASPGVTAAAGSHRSLASRSSGRVAGERHRGRRRRAAGAPGLDGTRRSAGRGPPAACVGVPSSDPRRANTLGRRRHRRAAAQQHAHRLDGRRQRLHALAHAAHEGRPGTVHEERHVRAEACGQRTQLGAARARPGDAPPAVAASTRHRCCRRPARRPWGSRLVRPMRASAARRHPGRPRRPGTLRGPQHQVVRDGTVGVALDDQPIDARLGVRRRPARVRVSARSRRRNTERSSW